MPFKKGDKNINRGGRPKVTQCIADILRKIGAEEVDTKGGKMPKVQALMRMVYKNAIEGDTWSVGFIADRTEGKAIQQIIQETEQKVIIEKRIIEDAKDLEGDFLDS